MAMQLTNAAVPLSRHVLFQSDDLDCAREMVARKFCRHKLEIVGDPKPFRARHHHFMGDMISLNYIDYGADVVIDPGALQDFYLIQIPLSGFATIRNGAVEVQADCATASVLNPHWETRMRWMQGCRHILVQIRKSSLEALASRSFGRELPGVLTFDPRIDLHRPEMARWATMVKAVFHRVDAVEPGQSPRDLSWTLHEQMLLEQFLWHQPSNLADFRPETARGPIPRSIRRAEEFIRHHAGDPITLGDMAEAAGCTSRSLQLAYQAAYGTTPLRALKAERLRRARFDLRERGDDVSVASIAMKWGFGHLGRFAADYREAFGELPHQTPGNL